MRGSDPVDMIKNVPVLVLAHDEDDGKGAKWQEPNLYGAAKVKSGDTGVFSRLAPFIAQVFQKLGGHTCKSGI